MFFYLNRAQRIWEKDERTRLIRVLNNKRSNLENELYARIYYTKSVAAYVSLRPDLQAKEFYNLAHELIQSDSIIKTMSLAKDGIIDAIFPTEGNEAVIGLNLFDHKERKEIVEKTIQTGKTFVAGPVNLVEGGIAFISYTPIFDKTQKGKTPFWGITDIVIKKDELIEAAGISENENGAIFAIRGYDGKGMQGDVFFGDPEIFESDPVIVRAKLPDGEWVIATIPDTGWAGYLDQDRILFLVLLGSGITISALLGLFASAMIRIRHDALQMSSIFRAMTGWVIEIDKDYNIVWMPPTHSGKLQPLDSLQTGQSLPGQLPQITQVELNTLQDCLTRKSVESFEFEIQTAKGSRWMWVTVSPKGDDHLILMFQEITLQKDQQSQLIASEAELLKLNANKDRLFSIIAHDLRSPLSAITGLSDQLLRNRDIISEEEQREFVELIYQSGKENLHLLENLLTWARSQQDELVVNKETIVLYDLCASCLNTFRELSAHKKIKLLNQIDPEVIVEFDPHMLEGILRNLVSNAIKFSRSGSNIEIGSRLLNLASDKAPCVEIFVKDSGVGMNAETQEAIIKAKSTTSIGTENESGAGLGLALCKDFLQKHGQVLRIVSAPGKGTTVYFTTPLASQYK